MLIELSKLVNLYRLEFLLHLTTMETHPPTCLNRLTSVYSRFQHMITLQVTQILQQIVLMQITQLGLSFSLVFVLRVFYLLLLIILIMHLIPLVDFLALMQLKDGTLLVDWEVLVVTGLTIWQRYCLVNRLIILN